MKNDTLLTRVIFNVRGSSLIEFAFVLPLFVLLICAIVEFGWYFVRYDGLSRALSVTVADLQNSGGTVTTTQTIANGNGSGIVSFGTNGNYICAQAYQTYANAAAANPFCASGAWALGNATVTCKDTGTTCTAPYWVGIVAYAAPMSLTGFVNTILPKGTAITQSVVAEVGGSSGSSPSTTAGSVSGGCILGVTVSSTPDFNGRCTSAAWGNAIEGGAHENGGYYGASQQYISGQLPAGYTNDGSNTAECDGNCYCPAGYQANFIGGSSVLCLSK